MGFGVSMKQKWDWVLDRTQKKMEKWSTSMLSLAGRVLIINHFFIPYVLYFLSCWRPPEASLRQFTNLCRNFLWSGDGDRYKIPKVSWEICTLHKDKGGLGILNVTELANRLNSKLMVRSLLLPTEDWAILIHRNINQARQIGRAHV